MTAVERFLALDAWPAAWGDDYEPTEEEYEARRAAIASAWAKLTDEECMEAGAPRVACAVCKRDYGRGISSTQAPACAAQIAPGADGQLYLTCHYESDRDGDAYAVRSPSSGTVIEEADPVCDACVRAYDEAGMLDLIGDYLHDATVAERVFALRSEPSIAAYKKH